MANLTHYSFISTPNSIKFCDVDVAKLLSDLRVIPERPKI